MAVSTSSYFSNAVQGIPQIAAGVDIYKMDATPRFAIGHKVCRQDGNEYVYSHFGADTGPGKMVSQDLDESSLGDIDIVLASAAATVTDGTVGSKFIQCTEASVTADQFAGGYLSIEDDTGEGYQYRIKGNTATNDPVTGDIRIELYDPIQVAVVAATTGNICGNLYANLEASTTTDIAAAGVSVANMDVSEAPYGWIQTAGVATVLTSGTQVIGSGTTLAAAGALAPEGEATILESPATTLIVGADTEYSVVKLTLK